MDIFITIIWQCVISGKNGIIRPWRRNDKYEN